MANLPVNCTEHLSGIVEYEIAPNTASQKRAAGLVPIRIKPVDTSLPDFVNAFTEDDGTYDFHFANPTGEPYVVEVEASYAEPATKRIKSSVIPAGGGDPYVFTTAEIPGGRGGDQTEDILIPISQNSGAFNIIHFVRLGFEWVDVNLTDTSKLEDLVVAWTSGSPATAKNGSTSSSASFYDVNASGPTLLAILSVPTDTDEFDESVLMHEFMHYVLWNQSFEFLAGSHSGPVRPDLAFGEGMPTAFGQDALEDSVYTDTANGGIAIQTDIETLIDLTTGNPVTRGTIPTSSVTGLISEDLIAGVVWDLLDGGFELHDFIGSSRGPVMRAVFQGIPGRSIPDTRGVAGVVDLVDLLDAWLPEASLLRLLGGQPDVEPELECLMDDIQFVYDVTDPETCPAPIPDFP
jgi:hypothetical protein